MNNALRNYIYTTTMLRIVAGLGVTLSDVAREYDERLSEQ